MIGPIWITMRVYGIGLRDAQLLVVPAMRSFPITILRWIRSARRSFLGSASMTALAGRDDEVMHADEIRAAFEDVFDQAVMFHGYADYMRDYDVFLHTTADLRTGIVPQHVRYRFTHCVRAVVTSTIPASVWSGSLDERLTDYEQGCDLEGYVWGVCWHALCPGMTLVSESPSARQWSTDLGIPFYEATIETNAHNISLVFSDLVIDVLEPGYAPFVVAGSGPEFKYSIP